MYCTQFSVEFMQFWTFNFSTYPHVLYKYNVHNFLSNLCSFGCSIFLQIQNISYMYCTQFQIEFLLFWTFNFSAYLDRPYINNVHNFPLNFRSSGYSIFLRIQTFRTYNVQNSPLNFPSTGYSIFLQIQPFLTYIMYTISRWIFANLDMQFFYQS